MAKGIVAIFLKIYKTWKMAKGTLAICLKIYKNLENG
jgi:hypothetical protein